MNRTTKLLCAAAAANVWLVIIAAVDGSMMPLALAALITGIAAGFWVAGRMITEAFKQEHEYAKQIRNQGKDIR